MTALGGSPVVVAAMRRNRVRCALLSVVAGVNCLVVFTVLGGAVVWLLIMAPLVLLAPTWSPTTQQLLIVAIAAGVVWVAFVTIDTLWQTAGDVIGGDGVRVPLETEHRVHDILDELSIATGIPVPREIGVVTSDAPNALAIGVTGRRTTIIITTGLLQALTRAELEAVLASQLIATARLDVAVRTLAALYSNGTEALYRSFVPRPAARWPVMWLWVVLLAPTQLVTRLVWRSVFVTSGLQGDELSVAVTRNPEALLRALVKVRDDQHEMYDVAAATVPLWLEPEDVVTRGASSYLGIDVLDRRIEELARVCGVPTP